MATEGSGVAAAAGGSGALGELEETRASGRGGASEAVEETRASGRGGASEVEETRGSGRGAGALGEALAETRASRLGGAQAEGPARLPRGAVVGRYVVVDRLGAGAMGVVYAAYDPELDRRVALKMVRPTRGEGTSGVDARSRLIREAQALARLSHPNVVGVHDAGVHGDEVWIAMEFVEGQTLSRWLEARRPGWLEALALMRAVGEGLAAAHAAGLVHRDVKPDNVMVGGDGRARIMDFGLARRGGGAAEAAGGAPRGALAVEVTQAGATVGTPAYMAPEQLRGEEVGAAADVFAFAVTLWEAIHGERPYAGETYAELVANVSAGRRRPPRAGCPRWLMRALGRGLDPDPGRRWADLRGLLGELKRRQAGARRRRLGAAAAAVAALAVAGAGAREVEARRAAAACAAAGASIAGEWGEAQRAAVEAAFLATGRPAAAEIAAQTLPWLDRWATAWAAAATEVCSSGHVQKDLDEAARARAEGCLRDGRAAFAALIRELVGADAIGLVRAADAAADLPQASACLDVRSVVEDAAGAPALRAELWRAGSLHAAGSFLAARAAAVAAAAAAAGHPLLRAEAERRVGLVEADLGDFAAAEAALIRALEAAGAAGSRRLALAAMTELVWVVGDRQARFAEGRVWAAGARAQLALLGEEDRLAAARLDSHAARALHAEGRYAEAAAASERALGGWIAALGDDHPRVADALSQVAEARAAAGALDEAIALHRRALAIREAALGEAHPSVARSLSGLASLLNHTRAFDEARLHHERALAIREAALPPAHPEIVESVTNLANFYSARRQPTEALALYRRALRDLEAGPGRDRRTEGKLLYNVALVQLLLDDVEGARASSEGAIAAFEAALGPSHPLVAYPLESLADALSDLGRGDEAVPLRERALALRVAAVGEESPEVASALARFAHLQRKRGAFAAAIELDRRAIAIYDRHPHPTAAAALIGLGLSLLEVKRPAEAREPLERALGLRQGGGEPRARAAAQYALAKALWESGEDRPRALELARAARDAYREVRSMPSDTADLAKVEAWLAARGG